MECGGESDHNPLTLKIKGSMHKPPIPFKFNASWISNPYYIALLKSLWVPLNLDGGNMAGLLLMENLKRLKKETILWAKDKKRREDVELVRIELRIASIMEGVGLGF